MSQGEELVQGVPTPANQAEETVNPQTSARTNDDDEEEELDLSSAEEQARTNYYRGGVTYSRISVSFQPVGESITGEIDSVFNTVKMHKSAQILIEYTSIATVKGETRPGAKIVRNFYDLSKKFSSADVRADSKVKNEADHKASQKSALNSLIHMYKNVIMPEDEAKLFHNQEFNIGTDNHTLEFNGAIPTQFLLTEDEESVPFDSIGNFSKLYKEQAKALNAEIVKYGDARAADFIKFKPVRDRALNKSAFEVLFDFIKANMEGGICLLKTARGSKPAYANIPRFSDGVVALPNYSPCKLTFNPLTEAVVTLTKEERAALEAERRAIQEAEDAEREAREAEESGAAEETSEFETPSSETTPF